LVVAIVFVLFFMGKAKLSLRVLALPVVGWLLSVGAACAVSPPGFFTTPAAQRWLSIIGTQNPLVARIACLAAMAIVLGISGLLLFVYLKS
jgi:cytochrome b561